jgi:hypothetical protein
MESKMRNQHGWTVVAVGAALLVSAVAEARPRYYVELRGVKEPAKSRPSLRAKAKAIVPEEFGKHPAVVTSLGDPTPKGKALAKALKARRLTGYGVILRITKASHSILPPEKGKAYRRLLVEVAVAIDAEKIPSGQMALAGQGNAQVATEISRYTEKERDQLAHEALTEAVRQAVGKSVNKLSGGKAKRRRRGRRRRR